MSDSRRFVFDTGVIVGASLFRASIPHEALSVARREGHLLASEATFAELREVLLRSKFDRYLSRERRREFLTTLAREVEVVGVTSTIRRCRDARDDKFLELAVSGRADFIVSGDVDLVSLHPFDRLSILSPRDFLTLAATWG